MNPDQFRLRIFDKNTNRYFYTNWKNFGEWFLDENCTTKVLNFKFDSKNHDPQICTYFVDKNYTILYDEDEVMFQGKIWDVRQNDDYGFELDRNLMKHNENDRYGMNSDVAILSTKIEKPIDPNKLIL